MADVYEKDLAQKTSLTTSDYIRVVGSDNVSYKQLITDVRRTMGVGTPISYDTLSPLYAEFASMRTHVKYFVTFYGSCAIALGLPNATYKGYIAKSSATICDMTVQLYPNGIEYIGRVTFDSSGNVTESTWVKQPTRAEVDAITPTYTDVTATTTSTGAFSIPTALQSKAIIDAYPTNTVAIALRRDSTYFMIKNATDMTAVANTSITLRIWHY